MSIDFNLTNLHKDAFEKLNLIIPRDQVERTLLSRQSHILNSNYADPAFDTFISLCQRIFNVPIAVVSLVDVKLQWFKSKTEVSDLDKDAILALCASNKLPGSSDLLVVADTLNDEIISKDLLVSDHPFIRFYAGAALIVEGDKTNLLDFSSTLSSLITLHRSYTMAVNSPNSFIVDQNNIMIDMMHQVRTPLMSIQLNTSLTESVHLELAEYLREDAHGNLLSIKLTNSITDLKSAISQLDTFVTSSLKLDELIIDSDHDNTVHQITKTTPVILSCNDFFTTITSTLSLLSKSIELEWNFDDKLTVDNVAMKSHPDLMKSILSFLISKVDLNWKKASIAINFRSYNDVSKFENKKSQSIPYNNYYNVKHGYLSIMISLSQPKNGSSSSTTNNNHFFIDLQPIQGQLLEIGGHCRTFNFDTSSSLSSYFESEHQINEQFFEFCLPCDLIITTNEISDTRNDTATSGNNSTLLGVNLPVLPVNGAIAMRRQSSIQLTESCKSVSSIHGTIVRPSEEENNAAINPLQKSYDSWDEKKDTEEPMYNSNANDNNSRCAGHKLRHPSTARGNIHSSVRVRSHQANAPTPRSVGNQSPSPPSHSSSSPRDEVLRVLLVDDSTIIYKVLKKWLEAEGCEVTLAENGKIGLSYLKTQTFDITFMDFIMPVMLGRDAMRLFQEWRLESCLHNINDDMLLVGMSANASQRDQEEAYRYGMHFFAAKPVDLSFLSIVLAAASKNQSLSKKIQEITINKSKSKGNSEFDCNRNNLCVEKKAVRSKKRYQPFPTATFSDKDIQQPKPSEPSVYGSNSTHVPLDMSLPTSSVDVLAQASRPSASALIRQYRQLLFSHMFRNFLCCSSKIIPTTNITTEV